MRLFVLLFIFFITQSQVVPSKTGSQISQKDAQKALDLHNKIRKEVGVPDLQWSKELSVFAQEWADHLAKKCNMEHRPRTGTWAQRYGENIFWGSNGDMYTVVDACNSWYSEKKDFSGPSFTGHEENVVGHYTQMVWRTTTKVGIGVAKCNNGAVIIVANYDPPGNYLGHNPY
jgi:pathogenesis-related protein 1